MTKAYVTGWRAGKNGKALEFGLHRDPERSDSWITEGEANLRAEELNGMDVTLDSPYGGKHHIGHGFLVEARASDKFVVFCALPW